MKWYEVLILVVGGLAFVSSIVRGVMERDSHLLWSGVTGVSMTMILFITLKERDWGRYECVGKKGVDR